MKFVVKQFINYGIFFGLFFVINSCAHFRITNLEKNNYQTKDFYQLLSKEYLDLAKYELYEMHDEIDARGLTPPQALSASLQMLASTINCFPKTTHEQLCSDIYTQLRSFCDLKTQ